MFDQAAIILVILSESKNENMLVRTCALNKRCLGPGCVFSINEESESSSVDFLTSWVGEAFCTTGCGSFGFVTFTLIGIGKLTSFVFGSFSFFIGGSASSNFLSLCSL